MKLFLFGLTLLSTHAFADTKNFYLNAVEINKTKYWLPADFKYDKKNPKFAPKPEAGDVKVKKGDTVILHLISKVGGANNIHGFAIDEFKVEALVDDKEKVIQFAANQPGTFKIRCHLHPAHIGGRLIVEE